MGDFGKCNTDVWCMVSYLFLKCDNQLAKFDIINVYLKILDKFLIRAYII